MPFLLNAMLLRSKDFLKLIDANTTYLRSDHQREFTEDLDLIETEPEELEIDVEWTGVWDQIKASQVAGS